MNGVSLATGKAESDEEEMNDLPKKRRVVKHEYIDWQGKVRITNKTSLWCTFILCHCLVNTELSAIDSITDELLPFERGVPWMPQEISIEVSSQTQTIIAYFCPLTFST